MWALQRKVLLLQTSVWAKTNTSACWPGPVSRLHTDKGVLLTKAQLTQLRSNYNLFNWTDIKGLYNAWFSNPL